MLKRKLFVWGYCVTIILLMVRSYEWLKAFFWTFIFSGNFYFFVAVTFCKVNWCNPDKWRIIDGILWQIFNKKKKKIPIITYACVISVLWVFENNNLHVEYIELYWKYKRRNSNFYLHWLRIILIIYSILHLIHMHICIFISYSVKNVISENRQRDTINIESFIS